ncbi:MAG: tripartite tricarboxylate transporter substrate binding protein [Burkholderiales bacterium]|nr:tripartite tricarboxylate transporter substrate binding protein [Burkholderiales bacterium]
MSVLARSVLALTLLWCAQALAQPWPSRPIRLIVPFPPGGTTDLIARLAQPYLQQSLGVPIVIDNRGGASGAIGAGLAARSAPDGHTFLLVWDTHAVNPSVIPNLPYDPAKDFAPIMLIGISGMVIATHPATPYRSLRDVIAAARLKPGAISYGTPGAGSIPHLVGALIGNTTKTTLTHVGYKGGGPMVVDILAGHVPTAIATVALLSPHVNAGRLRALAVTSARRASQFPDVPTISEDAVPGLAADSWWGMLAPANLPPPIVTRMHAEFAKALRTPALRERWNQNGLVIVGSQPADFGAFLVSEIARWGKVVRDNGITVGQ